MFAESTLEGTEAMGSNPIGYIPLWFHSPRWEHGAGNLSKQYHTPPFNTTVNLINDFYSRIPYKIQCEDKILTDIEIDEILKNDDIKSHGITIMPQKDDLKKLLKFLKKKEKR